VRQSIRFHSKLTSLDPLLRQAYPCYTRPHHLGLVLVDYYRQSGMLPIGSMHASSNGCVRPSEIAYRIAWLFPFQTTNVAKVFWRSLACVIEGSTAIDQSIGGFGLVLVLPCLWPDHCTDQIITEFSYP
jgi:hypothetical protein